MESQAECQPMAVQVGASEMCDEAAKSWEGDIGQCEVRLVLPWLDNPLVVKYYPFLVKEENGQVITGISRASRDGQGLIRCHGNDLPVGKGMPLLLLVA